MIDGAGWKGSGPVVDPANAKRLPKGSFMIDHALKVHWDGTKDENGALVCRVVMSDINEIKQVDAQREEALDALPALSEAFRSAPVAWNAKRPSSKRTALASGQS